MGVSRDSFHWSDYLVLVAMLAASLCVGIYHSCTGGKQRSVGEYFMGNRNLKAIPVGLSLVVSHMSSIIILGGTAEMYTRGTQWYFVGFGFSLSALFTTLLFVPLLHPLKLTSANEYLEMRYKSKLARLTGTFTLMAAQLIYMGVITFAPATALEAASNFPTWISILCTMVAAVMYTTIGGIKAVIWTDVLQSVIMVGGLIAILVVGVYEVGGIDEVWRINREWDRIEFFVFDPNPTVSNTVWSTLIGGGMGFLSVYGVNQVSVQRYSSLPTVTQARISVLINLPMLILLFTICCLIGTVVFAYFTKLGCDPLRSGQIRNPNQLLPEFLMRVMAYPTVPGIFAATLFSSTLSTISSSLNGLSAITWEDMLKSKWGHLPERRKTMITKILVVLYGCVGIAMAFACQQMPGSIIQVAGSSYMTALGPLLGLFILGALFPWANWIGAAIGCCVGLGLSLWISIGSYAAGAPATFLPTNVAGCVNLTMGVPPPLKQFAGIYAAYTVSYQWFPSIGILVTVLVGLLISFITGATRASDVDSKYLIPIFDWLCCCIPDKWRQECRCGNNEPNEPMEEERNKNEEMRHPLTTEWVDNADFKKCDEESVQDSTQSL